MTDRSANDRVKGAAVRAPRGMALSCKGWEQEAALRMLMNCADPDVAERPAAAGDAERIRLTLAALRDLQGDQTLLVRPGRPAGVLDTSAEAPRVVIAADGFDGLSEAAAATWLCVGTQTELPAAHEALAVAARKHFAGPLAGRLVMVGGMGATGGALPLAATLNGAAFLGVDADPEQIKRRVKSGYCEAMVNDLDEALRILKNSVRRREAASVGLIGNCAEVISELARRGIVPDLLVDCTPMYGSLDGYVPSGLTAEQSRELQRTDADRHRRLTLDSMTAQVHGMLELKRLGSLPFRFGGGFGERAQVHKAPEAPEIPEFAAAYIEPLRSEGRALLLWVALSGEPADIARADRLALDLFAADEDAARWIRLAGKHVQFQGLPARACLVDRALRAGFGLALNDLVARGELKAPVVIGCDDSGGGTEATSASAAILGHEAGAEINELDPFAVLSARARAASWAAIEDDGGRANGTRLQMLAVVADGTAEAARKIERALGDGTGAAVARPADAGSAYRDASR